MGCQQRHYLKRECTTTRLRRITPMTEIVIAGAARTPVGAFNGGLASLPAH